MVLFWPLTTLVLQITMCILTDLFTVCCSWQHSSLDSLCFKLLVMLFRWHLKVFLHFFPLLTHKYFSLESLCWCLWGTGFCTITSSVEKAALTRSKSCSITRKGCALGTNGTTGASSFPWKSRGFVPFVPSLLTHYFLSLSFSFSSSSFFSR